MSNASALAIYVLFWVMSAFVILPIGIRSLHEDGGEIVPGQERGAPANFRPKWILTWTTVLATILFAAYYFNYSYGWVTLATIGFAPNG